MWPCKNNIRVIEFLFISEDGNGFPSATDIFTSIQCCARGSDLRYIYLIYPSSYMVHLKHLGNLDFSQVEYEVSFAEGIKLHFDWHANLTLTWRKISFSVLARPSHHLFNKTYIVTTFCDYYLLKVKRTHHALNDMSFYFQHGLILL